MDISWTLDELLYYNREFGKHSVGVTLLHSADAYDRRTMNMDAENLPIEEALWNNMGSVSALRTYGTGLMQRQMESYMATISGARKAKGASPLADRLHYDGSL